MALRFTVVAVIVAAAGYGLHRLALWAENRGWIYYRTKGVRRGAVGMAMMEVATIVEPAVEHVIEEQLAEQIRADIAESGAAGDPGRITIDDPSLTGASPPPQPDLGADSHLP